MESLEDQARNQWILLDGNGSIYCSTGHQVNIYLPNGVTVLVEDLECVKGFCS